MIKSWAKLVNQGVAAALFSSRHLNILKIKNFPLFKIAEIDRRGLFSVNLHGQGLWRRFCGFIDQYSIDQAVS